MEEEVFEVFDVKSQEVFGTNMPKDMALILISGIYDKYFKDDIEVGIRKVTRIKETRSDNIRCND